MRRTMTLIVGGALALLVAAELRAQAPARPAAATTDISGVYTRLDTSGGGSYGGITEQFPRAQLRPEFEALVPPPADQGLGPARPQPQAAVARPNGTGQAYFTPAVQAAGGPANEGRCNAGGGGGVDINSSGMAVMQSKDEVVLVRDGGSGGRHIYLDGRRHPDPSRWIPNGPGHSIGHWENGNLVVSTVGMTAGVLGFGRGYRTPETELVETYKMSSDGKTLTITYAWNDPKVYVKPHVYDISFARGDVNSFVFEDWCDASIPHPENYTSIIPPAQLSDTEVAQGVAKKPAGPKPATGPAPKPKAK